MTTPDVPAPSPAAIPSPLADWGTRALGFLVDYAPIFIVNVIFINNRGILSFTGLLGIAYIALVGHIEGITGQSPGKALVGTRLVNGSGELIGSGSGIGRKFLHILDSLACGLGWLLPLVDAKRQTIADKVMTTYVVTGVEKRAFAFDLWIPPKQS